MENEEIRKIEVKSYAKINLSLDVLGIYENGYHQVEMVMQMLELHDTVRVQLKGYISGKFEGGAGRQPAVTVAGLGAELANQMAAQPVQSEKRGQMPPAGRPVITISSNREDVPSGPDNLAYRAAQLLLQFAESESAANLQFAESESAASLQFAESESAANLQYAESESAASPIPAEIEIHIEKRIPIAAGLAGGSGNAAAVLLGLNHLLKLNLGLKELCQLGVKLGADVPFCLMGQAYGNSQLGESIHNDPLACTCALAEGIGEKLTPVKGLDADVLLSKPSIGVSTAEVYRGIDKEMGFSREAPVQNQHHIDTEALLVGIQTNDWNKIGPNMSNILEKFTLKAYPIVMYTKNRMEQSADAKKVLMSGSGPTVFGIYTDKNEIKKSYEECRIENKETFLTHTLV